MGPVTLCGAPSTWEETMNKVFVLVLADTETKEALGRVVNAMQSQARRFRGVPGD